MATLQERAKEALTQLIALKPPEDPATGLSARQNTPQAAKYRAALDAVNAEFGGRRGFESALSGLPDQTGAQPIAAPPEQARPVPGPQERETTGLRFPIQEGAIPSNGTRERPIPPDVERPLPGPTATRALAPPAATSRAAPPAATSPLAGPAATSPFAGLGQAETPRGAGGAERVLELGGSAQQLPFEVTPPKTPEEEQALVSKWEAFFARPETTTALLQFAANVLQPPSPGQSTIGHIAQSAAGGLQAAGRVGAQQKEDDTLRRAEAREDRGLDIKESAVAAKSLGLKSVLDKSASAEAGEAVTRFATPQEILLSQGNLVPIPTGVRAVIGKDGNIRFSTGGLDLPASTENRLRSSVRSGQELLTNIGTMLNQVKEGGSDVVGPLGMFKGFVNVTAASFLPALFSRDRANFERQLRITREASKRVISDEERFTDADRDYVNELFPTPGFFGNPPAAEAKMQVMSAFFLRRLGPDMQALGIDTAQVPTLDLSDLLRLSENNLLTPQEIKRSSEMLFDKTLDLKSTLEAMVNAGFVDESMEAVVRQLFPEALQ